MRVLSLETSTSSAKALVYDDALGVVATAAEPFGADIAHPGQQDAAGVHAALLRVGSRVARGQQIDAIGLCSTWHSMCVCDDAFTPVTPVYTWEYAQAAPLSARMRQDAALTERLYRDTGCMPNITYPRQTLLYLREQGLTLDNRRLISQGAYSFLRMTGRYQETVNTQSGGGFIELATQRYDPHVLALLGIGQSQLGELVTYRDAAPLTEQDASALGLPPGIPVVPAHADGGLNQIGSGCAMPGYMTLSVGTSAAMRLTAQQPVLAPHHETWCYCGAEGFIAGAAVAGAGNCVNWFREEMLSGHLSFEDLEWPEDAPPREAPPVFLPFLYGERCPGWRDDRLAGFVEVSGRHGPRDLYLALRMGILFNMLQCYGPLTDMLGQPKEILVSGGILNAPRWCQMLADILNHPVRLARTHDASLMGAAVLALHAAGACADISAFRGEDEEGIDVLPVAENVLWYRVQYDRYLDWYARAQ